ncbi:radical SAM/SPASM domain-containing protein [Clostridium sp. UBA4395]|uniref:radical SAM/SPASM domain-containing protein n=1 Tax=Clostridium sp. UBA4395 TaxID=1946360 RepID=UPI00321805E3
MVYKKSKFNIYVNMENTNEKLVFNSFTGSLALMEEDTLNIIDNIDTLESIEHLPIELKENIDSAMKNGFILQEDLDEIKLLEYLREKSRFNKETLSLTIAVTMNCNMNCSYCFEEKDSRRMEGRVKEQLVEFVKKTLVKNKTKMFVVTWFGGEPLLEVDTIEELSDEFISICNENDIKYNSMIITNGSLLNRNVASKLVEKCKVTNAQVTLDGLKNTNDIRRHLKNNKSSFDIICNNIKEIDGIMNIQIRVNVDRNNINEAKELSEYFYKNGLKVKNFTFAPVTFINEDCSFSKSCYTQEEFYNYLPGLEENPLSNTGSPYLPSFIPYSCAALSTNGFGVDPEGNLYKCWTDIGIVNKSSGDIYNGVKLNNYTLKWLTSELEDKCKSCNILPLCQGGCLYHKFNNDVDTLRCITNENLVKQAIKEYYMDYIKQSEVNAI